MDIGKLNRCLVIKDLDFGLILDGGELGEILLPTRYIPEDIGLGDDLEVFIYYDSEDRLIATTETPKAMVGETAYLRVVDVNFNGAFLDWGLSKDLLVPYNEQATPMQTGKKYIVHIYTDTISNRIVASSKIDKRLGKEPHSYKAKDKVKLMIVGTTDLGYKAIVNNIHWGVLYENEVFEDFKVGQVVAGFIKKVRADDKLDLYIPRVTEKSFSDLETKIINLIAEHKGFLAMDDKTDPKIISKIFNVSKKTYKKALGSLYKKRLIKFVNNGISKVN